VQDRSVPCRQVGSPLKSKDLPDARAPFKTGNISRGALSASEDGAIRQVVAKPEEAGLRSVSDGALCRDHRHLDFLSQFEGLILLRRGGPQFLGV
jgi:methionine synthase II (cobalamin-independent)